MSDSDAREQLQDPHPDLESEKNRSNPESPGNDSSSQRNQSATSDAISEINPDVPIPSCIRFLRQGQNNQLLVAAVEPSEDFPGGIAINEIREWIRGQGCEGWFLHEETIRQLSREARRLKNAEEYIVAERKAYQLEIQISADRLRAWIRVSPAFGGDPLTETLLRQALEDHKVRFGINEALVQRIIQDGQCERELIAEGIPPTQGEPAKFEPLVKESEHKGAPQEREDGTVDYKSLGLFLSVTPGTPLLRHIPPTKGTPGTGVNGAIIPAPPIIDIPAISDAGAAVSKEDPDVIVATRVGQPYFFENSVRVDPILAVDAVDFSTGNLVFDGSIMIRGPVESGFEIKAGRDLTIMDTVEGSNLTAGRNLFLLTGVYGKGKSTISAKGDLEARFLSDCTIYCGGNIEIIDLIAHCNVECEGSIYLGKHGGKGQMFGGKLTAMRGIQAQILGSVSEAPTLVELAPPHAMHVRHTELERLIDATRQSLEIAEKNLQSMGPPAGGEDRIRRNFAERAAALGEKLDALKKERSAIQQKLDASTKGRIKAAQAHRGVTLRIGKTRQTITDLTTDIDFQPTVEEQRK